jgi:hypothetical protein
MIQERKTESEMIPLEFHLSQNYPNPFKDKTIIKYCIAYKTGVNIQVFNQEHKLIRSLIDQVQEAGTYEIEFDAGNLKEGEYYCQLRAEDNLLTKKMILTG